MTHDSALRGKSMQRLLLALLALAACTEAAAHGVADNHLQLIVSDNRVKLNIVVDMHVLELIDTDGDGYAGLDELRAERTRLSAWLDQAIRITGPSGRVGDVTFADVTCDLDIAAANGDRVDHARVIRTVQLPTSSDLVRIDYALLAQTVPHLKVSVVDGDGQRHWLDARRQSVRVLLHDE
ncbi:MAG: hypothetical protein AAGC71_06930 [Pseudomonadota bacterium]